MPGVLEKLKIYGFEKIEDMSNILSAKGVFVAYFNPESYSVSYGIEYDEEKPISGVKDEGKFKYSLSNTYSFELVLDMTGIGGLSLANPIPQTVDQRIADFVDIAANYKGDAHRPRYLKLSWGSLTANVVMESLDITYNLFAPDGTAIRARLSTSFRDVSSYEMMQAKKRNSSPDLTHERVIKQGDTLPGLCKAIYGDPGLYQEVARANQLTNFRKLVPGSTVFFPPLKKG